MKLIQILQELRGLNRKQLAVVHRTAKQLDFVRKGFAAYAGDPTPEEVKAVKAELDAIYAEFAPEAAKRGRKPKAEKESEVEVYPEVAEVETETEPTEDAE